MDEEERANLWTEAEMLQIGYPPVTARQRRYGPHRRRATRGGGKFCLVAALAADGAQAVWQGSAAGKALGPRSPFRPRRN
jgi:hypothetical protein